MLRRRNIVLFTLFTLVLAEGCGCSGPCCNGAQGPQCMHHDTDDVAIPPMYDAGLDADAARDAGADATADADGHDCSAGYDFTVTTAHAICPTIGDHCRLCAQATAPTGCVYQFVYISDPQCLCPDGLPEVTSWGMACDGDGGGMPDGAVDASAGDDAKE